MSQLTDDCFAFGGKLIPVADALARFREILHPIVEQERVPLGAALGRILAQDIVATRSVPPHDNSAVDGYAVYFDDLATDADTVLPVAATVAAGHPLDSSQRRGTAIRIFTGAPMPLGEDGDAPDTVMMQEDCRAEGDRVVIPPGIKRGANRRFAGEDISEGTRILEAGIRLRPQDIGLAAATGLTELPVFKPLRVAIFSTGDEIRDPGADAPSGTVYDSNRHTLAALLRGLGCEIADMGILPDRLDGIRDGLAKAAAEADMILTSGGVSSGGEDHVKAAVEAQGSLHSWRLAIKPGRPVALGQVGKTPFVGLPGNPVAVMVTFLRVARPLIEQLSGARPHAPELFPVRAAFDYKKKIDRREYVRVMLRRNGDGALEAEKFEREGAGVLSSMVAADGLVELPESCTRVKAGDIVDYLPFSEVGL
ncbi:molybdopterin molybdotransferase MoeA [Nisaea acidiphila]|uniref:Molybdopterin molybdenumtransferase n=1 Tax=Nisaea acidiphila TaxID=1862145 RepID=A0A9J7ANX1_9PROT|nr:gephyrin-like molybdotransferase Glp [Nisaea acidiphila]UUX49112.1 molybdopterin molybdotransferase MoeA [Nisaea acidiphila]